MELDELKNIWSQQQEPASPQYSTSELMETIDQQMDSLRQDVHCRDRREIIAGILLIIIFGYTLISSSNILTQLGSGIIVLASGYIIYRLKSQQMEQVDDSTSVNLPLRKHLQQELEEVHRQYHLIKTVAWWYLMPLTLGLFIMTIGGDSGFFFKLVYMLFVLLGGIGIWKYNQRAAKKKYEPLLEDLREAIEVVEEKSG